MNKSRFLLLAFVVAALVAGGVIFAMSRDDGGEKATSGRVVRIEAEGGACWAATLPVNAGEAGEESGCGSAILSLADATGSVAVAKTTAEGTINLVALVDDAETARQSTSEPFGTVSVTF